MKKTLAVSLIALSLVTFACARKQRPQKQGGQNVELNDQEKDGVASENGDATHELDGTWVGPCVTSPENASQFARATVVIQADGKISLTNAFYSELDCKAEVKKTELTGTVTYGAPVTKPEGAKAIDIALANGGGALKGIYQIKDGKLLMGDAASEKVDGRPSKLDLEHEFVRQ